MMLKLYKIGFIICIFTSFGTANACPANADPAQKTAKVTIKLWEKPLPNRSPIVTSPKIQIAKIKGKLVLITAQPIKKDALVYSFISLFNKTKGSASPYITTNYHFIHDNGDLVFGPQFSPDGTKVLFKDGWPYDTNGTYNFYILNTITGKLHSGPAQLMSFPITKWSPDGRYILFVSGGDVDGFDSNTYYPRKLYVYDTANGRSYIIDSTPRFKYYFWTKDDTVIYLKGTKVYESSANGLKHQEVLKYAENLMVSPDGNFLFYQGYKDPKSEKGAIASIGSAKPPGIVAPEPIAPPHFCIYDRKANKKYFFNQELHRAQYVWMHGVKNKVITLQGTVYGAGGVVTVSSVDLPSGKVHVIAKLPQLKGEQGSPNRFGLQTRAYAITKDNKYLIVTRVTQDPEAKRGFERMMSFNAISLEDGKSTTILRDANHTWDISGLDWN